MIPKYRAWLKEEKKMYEVRSIHFKTVYKDDIIVEYGDKQVRGRVKGGDLNGFG